MSEALPAKRPGQALRPIKRATTFATQALYAIEYALFRSVMGLFRVLGLKRGSDLGGWLARTIGPKIPVTRRAQRNMAHAFPDMSADERDRHIKAMWDNLGRYFAEYAHLDKFWSLRAGARIEIVGIEHAEAAI